MTRLLGIDPGFASIGWAVVETDGTDAELVAAGVLRTSKSNRKQNVLAAADNFRRAQKIARELGRLTHEHRIAAICAEAMSFPRSSSVAAKMAMCWGVLAHLCESLALPLAQVSSQQIKRAVTGNASASKDEVGAALCLRFPDALRLVAPLTASIHEHAYDAIGAVVACLDSDVVRAATRGASPIHHSLAATMGAVAGQTSTEGHRQKGTKGGERSVHSFDTHTPNGETHG